MKKIPLITLLSTLIKKNAKKMQFPDETGKSPAPFPHPPLIPNH